MNNPFVKQTVSEDELCLETMKRLANGAVPFPEEYTHTITFKNGRTGDWGRVRVQVVG